MRRKGKMAAALLPACLLSAKTDAAGESEDLVEGIVIDATMNSISIATAKGELLTFAMPDEVEKEGGLLLGMPVSVRLENGTAAGIADGVTQPQTDRDALAFAGSVLFMAESGSLQGLASLAAFPLTVHLDGINETIVAPEELEELGPSRIFTPARTDAILSANLYALREENGRWILGKTDGPNIVFRREGAGTGFYVAEIN